MLLIALPFILGLFGHVGALKISTSLLWIEHTPQPYAIKNFYKGRSPVTLSSGGVATLGTDSSFELAANAETQGLKTYAKHRNIRLIYVICDVPYRMLANKAAGIKTLADLKGKRIGTLKGSSAAVFIHNMMSSVGVRDNEYTTVSGNVCMKAPCASDTFPLMLRDRKIEAFGTWEPSPELGARVMGDNAIIFQNETVYREVYALYSTTDKLNNPSTRKDILEFVRALNQTLDVFRNPTEDVYKYVADKVKMDVPTLKTVWSDHKWLGPWKDDLIEYLVEEDKYLARADNRQVIPRKDLEKFLDTSILEEL